MYPELTVTSEEKHSLVITDSSRKKSLGLIKEGMENTVFLETISSSGLPCFVLVLSEKT